VRPRLVARLLPALFACLIAVPVVAQTSAQDKPTTPGPVLQELTLRGATVFTPDDVMWLLGLRVGTRLPGPPEAVARMLERRYHRDGYAAATVAAGFDESAGRLTLDVNEGRVDEITIAGVPPEVARRFTRELESRDIRPGQVFNRRRIAEALEDLLANSRGALRIGRPREDQLSGTPGERRAQVTELPDEIALINRGGTGVLVVPVRRSIGDFSVGFGSESREGFFNPVDGFAPSVGFQALAFDPAGFGHTFVGGYLSYKFEREELGYSLGIERPLLNRPRLFIGAEVHDITESDDRWRITGTEQTLVAITFKNTFRDYYRRDGWQVHAGLGPTDTQELVASWRWDSHRALRNESDFSIFRDDHPYRPNAQVPGAQLNALVLAYTLDTRGLADASVPRAYERHLVGDLFRGTVRQASGVRVDWTSEFAGRAMGGDYRFDRHILNARAYLPLSSRQSLALRAIAGFSGGTLPLERRFAIGGIGTVHGYGFKEVSGARMSLVNAEYRLDLFGGSRSEAAGSLRALVFFDAGRVDRPFAGSRTDWLKGIGAGLQTGPLRIEFGFRLHDIPSSRQILVRLSPTF
jgi:outer membrane protein insertion porin family